MELYRFCKIAKPSMNLRFSVAVHNHSGCRDAQHRRPCRTILHAPLPNKFCIQYCIPNLVRCSRTHYTKIISSATSMQLILFPLRCNEACKPKYPTILCILLGTSLCASPQLQVVPNQDIDSADVVTAASIQHNNTLKLHTIGIHMSCTDWR